MRPTLFLSALLAALTPVAATAQTPAAPPPAPSAPAAQPSPALRQRAAELIAFLNGAGNYDAVFDASFRAQIPRERFDAIGAQLRAQFGAAVAVERIAASGPHDGEVKIAYERGLVTVRLVVAPAAPNLVTGLLLTGSEARGDSAARIEADFRALPGRAGYGIYALGDNAPRAVAQLNGKVAAPLGSAFKLWVLAEAARAVNAGERRWSDVVSLGDRSLPSGVMQAWPARAPVTLHTLATLMISISDNTATDALLTALGRDRVDAMVRTIGVAAPDATLPVLTTIEAFRLKVPANAPLIANWRAMTPAQRRAVLRDHAAQLAASPVTAALFANGPRAQEIEWFASPRDMAATLDWLRRTGGAEAQAVLAVNPGTGIGDRFAYVGFKGGSEPGVITLNYLVRRTDGRWFAVTGNWHRPDADVEATTFVALMGRALALVPGLN